jgi:3-deoxy-D-manno-octulosonate 8-phosphate phosphatase (KDO 8-P phosphatase)
LKLSRIRAIALDVDGVLTDGRFWWSVNGDESKAFSFHDVMGISRGAKAGLLFALISGEDSSLVDRYAAKLSIVEVFKACKDKAGALRAFSERQGIPLAEICFMGDDVNDLSAMRIAGVSAAPANAWPVVTSEAGFVCSRDGGHGAVRELIEAVLDARALPPAAGV